jgi:signal transduction histidine kinase
MNMKKIRLRLTLFCAGITTLILIIMTLGYLYISEKNLINNQKYTYQSDIYSIAANLEQQNTISNKWLSQLEASKACYIAVFDNGNAFLFNISPSGNTRKQVINTAWDYYVQNKDTITPTVISYKTSYTPYSISINSNTYNCFVIAISQSGSTLEMLIAMPTKNLQNQIFKQRIIFTIIIITAIIAICILAWIFTGKMLVPIEENRIRQNGFVAAASHELRTPLAVILSSVESLQNKLNDNQDGKIKHDLMAIHAETLRVSHLLGDMLTLSSSDAGHMTLNKAPTELDTLVLNVYENFENMARQKNITYSIHMPDSTLPLFTCDKERIIQLITLLVHNAISYTPENGKIDISLSYKKKCFSISVADNGIGIPDEEKSKIFDRFYRSDKSRNSKEHFGLGLSIASEIVNAHNGHITVNDTPNGGATFTVYFSQPPLALTPCLNK